MTPDNKQLSSDTLGVIAATLLCVAAMAPFLVLPVMMSVIASHFSLGPHVIGIIGMVAMLGGPFGALLATVLVRRVSWPVATRLTLVTFCCGFAIAMLVQNLIIFSVGIFVSSLAGGFGYSIGISALSDTSHPERAFGQCVAAQVALQVGGMLALPFYSGAGMNALFISFILFAAFLIPLMGKLPAQIQRPITSTGLIPRLDPATLLAFGGCFMFFFNVGCVWTYIEFFGGQKGIDVSLMGTILAVGVGIGMLGALVASWYLERFSSRGAVFLVGIGTLASLLLFYLPSGWFGFAVGVAIYNYVWNFGLSQQYAEIAKLDQTGRSVALTPAIHGMGGALGPGVAAMVITTGYGELYLLAGVAVTLSCIFLIAAISTRHRPAES